MNRDEFLYNYTPVIAKIGGRPRVIGHERGRSFRAIVQYSKHFLYKREGRPPALGKEKWIFDNYIEPRYDTWEVWDTERNIVLRTTIANFREHCIPWKCDKVEAQLIMEEPFWDGSVNGPPPPQQGRFKL